MPEPGTLAVRRLDPDAVLPSRAHPGDAGYDLVSIEHHVLQPGERALVGTGVAVAIPDGWVGIVCPRSGLAARNGIALVNAPGVIDSGYRGELRVVVVNMDRREPFTIDPGDRIAQLVVTPALIVPVEEVEELPAATDARGIGGFGSTGVAAVEVSS
jgi:dUTP pyrophosphatase